jgi:23S rRNA maturation-related 3'-5' exoribonuclease YhaM
MEEPFKEEIGFINNPIVKEITEEGIALLPDYFYSVPASSTGKYHPLYALGEGGLYRHVKAAINIAVMLFKIYDFLPIEEDLIIASLILHDGWKQGIDGLGNSVHSHPLIATKILKESINTNGISEKSEYLSIICNNIASHMGQWTTSKWDSTILPSPKTDMEKFVHLCDYLASRKPLQYDFSVAII